jgi:hypothetical protein
MLLYGCMHVMIVRYRKGIVPTYGSLILHDLTYTAYLLYQHVMIPVRARIRRGFPVNSISRDTHKKQKRATYYTYRISYLLGRAQCMLDSMKCICTTSD